MFFHVTQQKNKGEISVYLQANIKIYFHSKELENNIFVGGKKYEVCMLN